VEISNKHVLVGTYGNGCGCQPLPAPPMADGVPGMNVLLTAARSGNTIILEITRTAGHDNRSIGAPVVVVLRGEEADVLQESDAVEALRHERTILERDLIAARSALGFAADLRELTELAKRGKK